MKISTFVPAAAVAALLAGCLAVAGSDASPTAFPDPKVDLPADKDATSATLVLGGGCFWTTEAVFERVPGVTDVVSGYSGGEKTTADYETVCTGTTGHAEAVKITYDPSKVTFGQLLKVFFAAAIHPTQKDGQGADTGSQYRSAIFYANDEQKSVAEAYIKQIEEAKVLDGPIATKVEEMKAFYPAEEYHQDYVKKHPDQGYVRATLPPKLERLKRVEDDAKK